jgi:hypothetical protein
VTKTLAKPPKPPTNGAPGIRQLLPPMYRCSELTPALTMMPVMTKITMVTTFKEESQYSSDRDAGMMIKDGKEKVE